MKEKLLSCGTFAKICQVEKHVLFHYDEIGLFKPIYVNEKGYRYYSYRQYDTFKVILALKKLGMSLKDIQVYLNQRNPQDFLNLLNQQEDKLKEAIQQLTSIHEMIKNYKHFTEEGLQVNRDDIFIQEYPTVPLLLSENIENASTKDFGDFMKSYTTFIENHNIITSEFVGMMLSVENILKEDINNYSYFFTTTKQKQYNYIKAKGAYLCAYNQGEYASLEKTYKKMIDYAKSHHLELGKYAYEEYILADISSKKSEDYLTKISIQILNEKHL